MSKLISSFKKIPRWARRLLYLFIFLLTIYLFKGSIYRTCFHYQLIRCRSEKSFGEPAQPSLNGKNPSGIINESLAITAKNLSFTTERCETDPKALYEGAKTNCIGYANECSLHCNNFFWLYGFSKTYKAESYVAQIYFFGFNIHGLFSSPFWKDHDVVVITNASTGEKILLDPTLYDYTGIGIVRERK